jgi:hypothetical protein
VPVNIYAQIPAHLMAHEAEPTIISAIMLSDLAIVEQGTQKRSLIGTFDQFGFHQFPAQYGRFFITASITNIEGKFSKLELTYRIEKRGHVVFSNSTTVQFDPERQIVRDTVMGLSIGVQGVIFPEPGTYTVVVLLDGDEIGKRDFGVIQVPQQ